LAWLKWDPVQFVSVPTLATPEIALRRVPVERAIDDRATVEPAPFTSVSACSTSS
jgi:hypothetical protein